MVAISNVDRAVLLLRQRLERARAGGAAHGSPAGGKAKAAAPALRPVQALAALGELEPRQLRRALIQAVLADQFGEEVLNEAEFQQVVDRVAEAIGEDESGREVVDQALAALRAQPR